MTSPRLNGLAEKMGTATRLPEFSQDYGDQFEKELLLFLDKVDLGKVALSALEVRLPRQANARVTLVAQDDFMHGREDGVHGGRAGQMILNGSGLHESPTLIHLKPFADDIDQKPADLLAREMSMDNYLNSLTDEQLAFIPLGVWKNAQGINHLLTLYEHDVISYDNVFWADKDVNPEALRQEAVEDAYKMSLLGLGYLHGLGISHGDAEAKNLARDRKSIRFIDLETATIIPTEKQKAVLKTRQDIETFIDSTLQIDENRQYIEKFLDRKNTAKEFAKLYRAGIRAASQDSGLRPPRLITSTDEYFMKTIQHARTVAHNHHDKLA